MRDIRKNTLHVGGIPASKLVREHGTPLYVYDTSTIRKRYRSLTDGISYPKTAIYYAIKANAHPQVLSLLAEEGSGAETVSLGEIKCAKKAGFQKEKIVFTSSSLSEREFEAVMNEDVEIHIDSLNQLKWYGERRPGSNVSLRINTDIGDGHHAHVITGGALSKFGIHHSELDYVKQITSKHNLSIVGLHQHIGSFILDENMFIGGMNALLDIARAMPDLQNIDFGGGFGVPYEPHEEALDFTLLGEKITNLFERFCDEYGRELQLSFEPGRLLVAESGYLLTEVTDKKCHSNVTYVGLNTGFNHLVRPMMYSSYHEIIHIEDVTNREISPFTVVGNICESGDVFARDRHLPEPHVGDILAICDVGAYGFVMASRYNQRELPKEVVV